MASYDETYGTSGEKPKVPKTIQQRPEPEQRQDDYGYIGGKKGLTRYTNKPTPPEQTKKHRAPVGKKMTYRKRIDYPEPENDNDED